MYSFFLKNRIFQKVINILKIPFRDPLQNTELAEYLLGLEYFKKFKLEIKDLLDIASVMTYVHIPARTQIFDYGEIGDALYLILDGVVDVVKPLEKTPATSMKAQYEKNLKLRTQSSEGE